MKMNSEVEAMFEVPKGHTPKVLMVGGTDHKNFSKAWEGMVDEKIYKDMDGNSSRLGLPLHPVLVLIVQGEDGHIHALISLPLQKWEVPLRVNDAIEESKDLRRVMDYCAGFLEVFCMNDTVTAVDLATNVAVLGDSKDGAFSLEEIVKEIRPKKDVRTLDSIGNADDILGQLSKPQIEKFQTKKKEPKVEKLTRVPMKEEKPEENKLEKTKKEQQAIVKKYGFPALKEMSERMKFEILVKDSHG